MKSMKYKNKYFESDQEGYIRICRSIYETKGKGHGSITVDTTYSHC